MRQEQKQNQQKKSPHEMYLSGYERGFVSDLMKEIVAIGGQSSSTFGQLSTLGVKGLRPEVLKYIAERLVHAEKLEDANKAQTQVQKQTSKENGDG